MQRHLLLAPFADFFVKLCNSMKTLHHKATGWAFVLLGTLVVVLSPEIVWRLNGAETVVGPSGVIYAVDPDGMVYRVLSVAAGGVLFFVAGVLRIRSISRMHRNLNEHDQQRSAPKSIPPSPKS